MKKHLLTAAIVSALSACGGGSSTGSDTVAVIPPPTGSADPAPTTPVEEEPTGAPIIAVGTIDGFGSIYVNGIRFDTDKAEIDNDGEIVAETTLATGMVVTVEGTVSDDGVSGTAERVFYDAELKGQITDITATDSEDSKSVTVLGINVIVERTATVFEGTVFDTLAVNDWIEVYGTKNVGGALIATRIEAEDETTAQSAGIELKGSVSGVTDSEFTLGLYTVQYATAIFEDGSVDDLIEGAFVEVNGTLDNDVISARRIEFENSQNGQDSQPDNSDDTGIRRSIEGIVADFESAAAFSVRGVVVDATNARLEPSDLNIANGVYLEVKGPIVDGILQATSVELERGDIEFYATVDNIDEASFTVTLNGEATTIQVNNRTLFDDDRRSRERANFSDLAVGDFVEVEAYQDTDGALIATRVDIEDPTQSEHDDDEIEVKGPVTDFVASSEITVVNTTFSVDANTRYEIGDRENLTAEAFFAELVIGDLVEIKDRQPADGIADEIDLETYRASRDDDSDDESDDDVDSNDDSNNESDDDLDSDDDSGNDSGDDVDSDDDSNNDSEDDLDSNDDSDNDSEDDLDSNDDSDNDSEDDLDSNDDSDNDSDDDLDSDDDSDDETGDDSDPV
jgi:hypothetical protein